MKKVNPGQRVLLSTGFSADHGIQDFLDEGPVAFIKKPYSMNQLAEAIIKALRPDPDRDCYSPYFSVISTPHGL